MSTLQNLLEEADSCKEKISSFALKSYVTKILGQSAPGSYVLELADIAPFNQGNRETAYYLMNFILIRAGYCPAEPFYEEDGYINSLAKSRSRHDMEPFSLFAVQYVLKAQKDCLKASALL